MELFLAIAILIFIILRLGELVNCRYYENVSDVALFWILIIFAILDTYGIYLLLELYVKNK